MPRCRLQIDPGALRANLDQVRARLTPGAPLIAMVKAGAYGFGTRHVVPVFREAGVTCFGVAAASEATDLRAEGVTERIVVFGPFCPGMEAEIVAARAEATVSDLATIRAFAAAADPSTPAPLHLEIDTGLGRSGFRLEGFAERVAELQDALALPGVHWAGVFTHLHSADEPGHPGVAEQVEAFQRALELLDLPESVEVHLANSAGSFWPDLPDGVGARPGLYLYGGAVPGGPIPAQAGALRARITRVVDVPEGATVGYGATWSAPRPTRLATAAIGYADGLPRALSNCGRALINGRSAPIVGRLSMDLTVLDVTDLPPVEPGAEATFLGPDGDAAVTPEEVASHADTIAYEIFTRIAARVARELDPRAAS